MTETSTSILSLSDLINQLKSKSNQSTSMLSAIHYLSLYSEFLEDQKPKIEDNYFEWKNQEELKNCVIQILLQKNSPTFHIIAKILNINSGTDHSKWLFSVLSDATTFKHKEETIRGQKVDTYTLVKPEKYKSLVFYKNRFWKLKKFCDCFGFNYNTIFKRMKRGWSLRQSINQSLDSNTVDTNKVSGEN